MKIAFNPSNSSKNILDLIKNNKDIIFDLKGHSIYARGVEFKGTDTNTWRPVVDNLASNSATSSLSANQGRVLAGLINGKSDSDHNHDGRYIRKSGDTMLGALNFANGTWNLVGDDSYMGDCNISGHFGIKAANTTYPGIAFFNNASAFLGNLTAYSGNIKYGAYSLQFLDNGNTSVSSSTWTNPFSAYNSNAVADGQAICVWGQASQLSNLSTDTGDMSLWLKRVNAKVATLNIVLDGEYYANGNQRLAHISEIPTSLKNPHALTISLNGTSQGPYDGSAAKNINITPGSIGAATSGHNHDGRYLALSGGTMTGTINRHSGGATISGRDHAIIRQTYAPGGSSWNPIACVDTETGTWTLGHLSSGDSDTNFHFCFSTNTDYNAGNNAGNYVTLRNKVGTIALLSEIPDKNSWNYDDRYVRYYAVTTLDCNNLAVGLTAARVTATNAAHTNHSAYLYISDVGTPFQIQIPDSSVPYIYKRYYGSDGWSGWFKLNAGYADSATKLQTARRIWGQSFNGTADVNGLLTHIISSDDQFLNVHDNRTSSGYQAIRYFRNGADVAALHWFHDKFGGYNWNSNCLNLDPYRGGYVTLGRWDNPDLTVVRGGNIGIGTTSPPYKLTVDGVGGDCVPIQLVNASRDGNWVCNAAFFAPNLTNNHNNTITIGKNYNSRNAFGLTHIHIGDGSSSNYAALEVWGVGNVQRWYYDRHSAFLHRADFSSLGSDASYMNSALQIREHSYGGTQADTWANAPRMSWHWSGRVQTQIGLGSDNELYLSKNNFGNAYRLMYETGTWGINISGNAASATNADKLDGCHYNSFAPFNGVKFVHGPDSNVWHRILQFTTNWVGQVTFMYSPEECQRSYWGIFNINIRSKDIWFRGFSFADLPTIKCIGDDNNNWSVWVKGTTNSYDPYGVIQVLNYSNASIVNVGLDKSQTTEPSGTYNKAPSLFYAGFTDWNNITNKPSMFNPAAHTHTWTSITDKIVAGNEFNIVNAGFKEDLWFNYLPINDRSKSATISAYCFGNGNKGYTAVRASGFIKNGGNENQLLRADGGVAAFNWSGQSGQPAWLWGGNDFNSYYVYNPSNFRVAYASSAGNAQTLGGFPKNYGQAPFGTIPCIGDDGVMEIGRYIDYHYDNSGKYDFSTRLQTTGNYANVVNLPSASGTLALISQVLTWKSQIIDMRSYSESYWHPVTVPLPNFGYNKIKVSVQLNSGDKPSWATHRDGITCNMEIWATASGWGTTDSDTICLNYTYKFCSQNPCGWMQLGNPSLGVVFLRGGSRYTVYTDFDATFTPHNQKYTWSSNGSSQDTGGPYTSCPGLNFNMGAIRADLIATMVQARRVCAGHDPGIDNSISCSNWFRSSGNTGWYNTTYRGGWYMSDTSWIRTHNSVGIYTSKIYADSSIRMSSICLEKTNEINSSDNLLINYGSSTNVSLCNGGGNVGIGTISPTQKLDVNGNITTKGFGIQPCYLSELNLLPTISPGDGYTYKCLEIGRTTDISCIIADKAGLMSERGILIKFNKGYDGQIILLKDLQSYGIGNGNFWVMPSGCNIIKADSSSILVGQNQISNTYDDGHSRFLVYSSLHNVWIEFLCANIN